MDMRLSIIEMEKDETVFYNLGIFNEHEDLIVFPIHEFLDFYEEIEHRLICKKNIIKTEYPADPVQASKYLDPHLELLESEIDGLLNFEVQTTLESFNKTKQTKSCEKVPEPEKEDIQCLIGL